MNYFESLKNKIKKNKATVCIIGLGYVGTALIEKLSKVGFNIIGIDKNKSKFKKIDKKKKIMLSDNYKYIANKKSIFFIKK